MVTEWAGHAKSQAPAFRRVLASEVFCPSFFVRITSLVLVAVFRVEEEEDDGCVQAFGFSLCDTGECFKRNASFVQCCFRWE